MKYGKDLVDCDVSSKLQLEYVTEEYCHAMHVLHLLHAFLIRFFFDKESTTPKPYLVPELQGLRCFQREHCPFNGPLTRHPSASRNSCEPRSWELWELAP